MWLRSMLIALCVAVAAAGCTDDDTGTSESTADELRFAVLADPSWELQEAVDLRADDPAASTDRPPLDWYAEYVRASHTEMVRLSGHDFSLDRSRASLEDFGFGFEEVDVPGHSAALAGQSELEQSGPAIVMLANGSRTLVLLSYELTIEELTAEAVSVETVSEADWIAAGGIVNQTTDGIATVPAEQTMRDGRAV